MHPKPIDVIAQVTTVLATAIAETRADQEAVVQATWAALNKHQKGTFALSLTESDRGYTQQRIADIVGMSQPTIGRYITQAKERRDRNEEPK